MSLKSPGGQWANVDPDLCCHISPLGLNEPVLINNILFCLREPLSETNGLIEDELYEVPIGQEETGEQLGPIFAWIRNHMSCQVWNEITYPLSNFKGCTFEVWSGK